MKMCIDMHSEAWAELREGLEDNLDAMLSHKAIEAESHVTQDGTESLYMQIEGGLKRLKAMTDKELKAGSVSSSGTPHGWHHAVLV